MDPTALDPLVQYGVLGLVVLALILGWLVPKWAYDAKEEENKRLRAENAELRQVYETKVIPALITFTELLGGGDRAPK